MIIDDNSPDGTGNFIEKSIKSSDNFTLIRREKKLGLDTAHKFAYNYAIKNNYSYLITMDADFSHLPDYIPDFLSTLKENDNYDIVIGSGYIKGGSIVGWPLTRHLLSKGANYFARSWLSVETNDITTGFFLVRKKILSKIDLKVIQKGFTNSGMRQKLIFEPKCYKYF